jgi:hypothetical protein
MSCFLFPQLLWVGRQETPDKVDERRRHCRRYREDSLSHTTFSFLSCRMWSIKSTRGPPPSPRRRRRRWPWRWPSPPKLPLRAARARTGPSPVAFLRPSAWGWPAGPPGKMRANAIVVDLFLLSICMTQQLQQRFPYTQKISAAA